MKRNLILLLIATLSLLACSKSEDTTTTSQNYVSVTGISSNNAMNYAKFYGDHLYISDVDFIGQPGYVGPVNYVYLAIADLEPETTYTLYTGRGAYDKTQHFLSAECGFDVFQDEYGDLYEEYEDEYGHVYQGTFISQQPVSGTVTVRTSRSKYRITYDITFPNDLRMTGSYIGEL
jgi:hypothetical protein